MYPIAPRRSTRSIRAVAATSYAILQTSREHAGAAMSDTNTTISELLNEAAETHHEVYRLTVGTDEDWDSWYSDG